MLIKTIIFGGVLALLCSYFGPYRESELQIKRFSIPLLPRNCQMNLNNVYRESELQIKRFSIPVLPRNCQMNLNNVLSFSELFLSK